MPSQQDDQETQMFLCLQLTKATVSDSEVSFAAHRGDELVGRRRTKPVAGLIARLPGSANQGITSVMTPSAVSPLLMPSRAIDSMTGHFCRNTADASCMYQASTLTQHARRPPSFAI